MTRALSSRYGRWQCKGGDVQIVSETISCRTLKTSQVHPRGWPFSARLRQCKRRGTTNVSMGHDIMS